MTKQLGVNIDHIATLRQQRKEGKPNLIEAARIATEAGADYITVHLREDRRHIQDEDVKDLIREGFALNLECAATEEMLAITLDQMPQSCCLVPEKREELTTEGGLDLRKNTKFLSNFIKCLQSKKIEVSLFIEPSLEQVNLAKELGADTIELHTGSYSRAYPNSDAEFDRLLKASKAASDLGLKVNLGHGLDYENIKPFISLDHIAEFNIGFSIVCQAMFSGLKESVLEMKTIIRSV